MLELRVQRGCSGARQLKSSDLLALVRSPYKAAISRWWITAGLTMTWRVGRIHSNNAFHSPRPILVFAVPEGVAFIGGYKWPTVDAQRWDYYCFAHLRCGVW